LKEPIRFIEKACRHRLNAGFSGKTGFFKQTFCLKSSFLGVKISHNTTVKYATLESQISRG
jgi:hypothetical protein